MSLKSRMTKILESLNENIYERDEVLAVTFLSALANQNIFLYGPPGTAKSLISRRISKAFKTEHYFEYLMQKFSTPDEVFGPMSITELKKDKYVRKTDGYLPSAEFAFLDEIWKSSPAILNTLLTIINEKIFKNGNVLKKVPMKVLISASNETPPKGQGLEALYDRFTTRLYVPPMESKENFEQLLQNGGSIDTINIDEKLLITTEEWIAWKEKIQNVKVSQEVLNIVHAIRLSFLEKNKSKGFDIYVSDRRWLNALTLVKAGAFFCEREETNIVDALLLSHTLWTTKENREVVIKIVHSCIKESGFETGNSLKSLDEEKEKLEQEINKELFYSNDIYETVKLHGNTQYFKVKKIFIDEYNDKKSIVFYIARNSMKTKDEFHPVDENGNEISNLKCSFKKQGSCEIKYKNNSYYNGGRWVDLPVFQPQVLFYKGDKRKDVNERLIEALREETEKLSQKIEQLIEETKEKETVFLKELDTPFIEPTKIKIATESISQQIEDLKLRHKDTQRLVELVG